MVRLARIINHLDMKTMSLQEAIQVKRKVEIKLHRELAEAIIHEDMNGLLDLIIHDQATGLEVDSAKSIAEIAQSFYGYELDNNLVEAYLYKTGDKEDLRAIALWQESTECGYDRVQD